MNTNSNYHKNTFGYAILVNTDLNL